MGSYPEYQEAKDSRPLHPKIMGMEFAGTVEDKTWGSLLFGGLVMGIAEFGFLQLPDLRHVPQRLPWPPFHVIVYLTFLERSDESFVYGRALFFSGGLLSIFIQCRYQPRNSPIAYSSHATSPAASRPLSKSQALAAARPNVAHPRCKMRQNRFATSFKESVSH